MKKYLYLLFIATALFSCSKEAQTPENLKQKMLSKWRFRTAKVMNYSAQGKATDSTSVLVTINDFFEFKADGSFNNSTLNGKELESGTFATSTTSRFTLKMPGSTSTCRVINLDADNFVFAVQEPKVTGQPYIETKYTLYR